MGESQELYQEYGMDVVNFIVEDISVPEDDPNYRELQKALSQANAEAVKMQRLGYSYQEKRTYDILQDAAQNEGTSSELMGAGMGMGMGFKPGRHVRRSYGWSYAANELRNVAGGIRLLGLWTAHGRSGNVRPASTSSAQVPQPQPPQFQTAQNQPAQTQVNQAENSGAAVFCRSVAAGFSRARNSA